ncbi:hypothetical protein WKW47_07240 [Staphylococcus nepalensis]|uniref:hypothetical protein n=1 Tax=Staphylococcus nepalensis TaxID=214473 RepID=UPI003F496AE4
MAYEYEESNKQIVFTVDNESSMGELNERIKELEEVYRKAKALERIKDIHSDYSIGDAKCIEMIGDELERADDGV